MKLMNNEQNTLHEIIDFLKMVDDTKQEHYAHPDELNEILLEQYQMINTKRAEFADQYMNTLEQRFSVSELQNAISIIGEDNVYTHEFIDYLYVES